MSDFETLTIIGGKGPAPSDWKVNLGGKDISSSVRGIKIAAFVNEIVDVELHLITEVGKIEIVHLQMIDPSDDAKDEE